MFFDFHSALSCLGLHRNTKSDQWPEVPEFVGSSWVKDLEVTVFDSEQHLKECVRPRNVALQ